MELELDDPELDDDELDLDEDLDLDFRLSVAFFFSKALNMSLTLSSLDMKCSNSDIVNFDFNFDNFRYVCVIR